MAECARHGEAALVTGAGGGVGGAVARLFAARGLPVVVNYRQDDDAAQRVVRDIEREGGRAFAAKADVTDSDAVDRMVEWAQTQVGPIRHLVNCAAYTEFIPFPMMDQVTPALWDKTYRINVLGAWNTVRAVTRTMPSDNGASLSVVNVGSVAALDGSGSCIPYAVSKAALMNLTVCLARTLAPRVRVNYLAPGFIDTDWYRRLGYGDEACIAALRRGAADATALGRVSSPEEIAAAVSWLALDAPGVTGEVIRLDNGAHVAGTALRSPSETSRP